MHYLHLPVITVVKMRRISSCDGISERRTDGAADFDYGAVKSEGAITIASRRQRQLLADAVVSASGWYLVHDCNEDAAGRFVQRQPERHHDGDGGG